MLKEKSKQYNSFLKYSGLGIQLTLTLGAFGAFGYWLDTKLELRFPIFLLSFVILALIGSIYLLYRSLPK
ncbi:AtpZ/AtpI family protein [Fulvivirga sp. M361]|uniref:AtpZ/AtpI family protein n=1 Tax=Fulvivirga sp. M361 TaxID=2594266 RepID=UPI0016256911